MRPESIVWFERLYIASLAIAAAVVAMGWDSTGRIPTIVLLAGIALGLLLPLQFVEAPPAFDGSEIFTIEGVAALTPRQEIEVRVSKPDGGTFTFATRCRIDTLNELEYFRHGGILQFVLRNLAAG